MEITKRNDLSLQQPSKFYAALEVKGLNDVIKSETPALATIVKDNGKQVAKSLVIIALVDLIEFYNVSNTFSDTQINSTSDLIMTEFYWLKPEDFKLCFNNAKIGKYGQLYNRLDGAVIFEWLNTYQNERAEFFALQRSKENFPAAVRANETKEIHKLYDEVVKQSLAEQELNNRKKQLREAAKVKWQSEYNLFFEGVEISEQAHMDYISKFPLNESYIQFYIKKNL